MKKILLATFGFITLATHAATFTKPQVNFELAFFDVKESALLSRGVSTIFDAPFAILINEQTKVDIWPAVNFVSGQQTSRDPQTTYSNSIYLKEAALKRKLPYDATILVGALNQKQFAKGLSGNSKSFPGMGLMLPYKMENHSLLLSMEAAVPTSSGLATTQSELDSSSSLFQAGLGYQFSLSHFLNLKLDYTHFLFNQLSSATASDSLQKGNTVARPTAGTGVFVYKYQGHEVVFQSDVKINPDYQMNFKTGYIHNAKAPTDLNLGYYFNLAVSYQSSAKIIFTPFVEKYHIEADAYVATFADSGIGRTNRDGVKAGLKMAENDYALQVYYAESDLIQTNPFQSYDRSIFLGLEIKNILF